MHRRIIAGVAAGIVTGALLGAALPVGAANGDPLQIGAKNNGIRTTKLISRGGMLLKVGTAGTPALTLEVEGDTPPLAVNSSALVDNLNADLLDGEHGAEFHTGRTEFFLEMNEGDVETLIAHGPLSVEIACAPDGDTAHQNELYVDSSAAYYAFGTARPAGRNLEATWQNWSGNQNIDRFYWVPSTGQAVWLYVGIADEDIEGADCIVVGRAESIG